MVIQGTILELLLPLTIQHRQHASALLSIPIPADVLGLATETALGLGLEEPAMHTSILLVGPTHTSSNHIPDLPLVSLN